MNSSSHVIRAAWQIARWNSMLVAASPSGPNSRPGPPVRGGWGGSRWGYTRIRVAMTSLGHEIGRSTVERILRDSGIEPAPQRGERSSWRPLLATHSGALAAADL